MNIVAIVATRYTHDDAADNIQLLRDQIGPFNVVVCDNRPGRHYATFNLHEMWNAATDQVSALHDLSDGELYIAYVNDDIVLTDTALEQLAHRLHTDPDVGLMSVAGGRPMHDQDDGYRTCTPGHGNFTGATMMVRRSLNYRFPSWLCWYYGDFHLMQTVHDAGYRIETVTATQISHATSASIRPARREQRFQTTLDRDGVLYSMWDAGELLAPTPRPGRYGHGH